MLRKNGWEMWMEGRVNKLKWNNGMKSDIDQTE